MSSIVDRAAFRFPVLIEQTSSAMPGSERFTGKSLQVSHCRYADLLEVQLSWLPKRLGRMKMPQFTVLPSRYGAERGALAAFFGNGALQLSIVSFQPFHHRWREGIRHDGGGALRIRTRNTVALVRRSSVANAFTAALGTPSNAARSCGRREACGS